MIFWHRRGREYVLKTLERVLRSTRLASMKVAVARNIMAESRRSVMDKLLLQTAFAGFPVPSSVMARMYATSAMESLKKALKDLERVREALMKDYPHLYLGPVKEFIEPAIETLKDLVSSDKVRAEDIAGTAEEVSILVTQAIEELRVALPPG